jgi:hypothetical protein
MTLLLLVLVIPILVMTAAVTPKPKACARCAPGFDRCPVHADGDHGGAETVKGMGIERPGPKWKGNTPMRSASVTARSASTYWSGWQAAVECHRHHFHPVDGYRPGAGAKLTIGQLIAQCLDGSVMSPLMGWHYGTS